MNRLGKIEISDRSIRELSSGGHESMNIHVEDVSEIEFSHGSASESPILQLIIIAVLLPVAFWCGRMLMHDFLTGFSTGSLRPVTCGFVLIGIILFTLQVITLLIPQPHLRITKTTGFRKVRFGRGITSTQLQSFYEKLTDEMDCNVKWSI